MSSPSVFGRAFRGGRSSHQKLILGQVIIDGFKHLALLGAHGFRVLLAIGSFLIAFLRGFTGISSRLHRLGLMVIRMVRMGSLALLRYLRCSGLAEAEHVREAKLRNTVAVGDLALCFAKLTACIEFFRKGLKT